MTVGALRRGFATKPQGTSTVELATGSCPTLCDNDCEADCHEAHAVTWKRDHQPDACPSRP